jgi:hypothetical protein
MMNMEIYYPSILAKFNVKECCPICKNSLDIKNQYLYMKKYKDECSVCMKYNSVDTPYCLCEQSSDYMINAKIITCTYCNTYPKYSKRRNENCFQYDTNYSYKELYRMAKDKNIKHRSAMSKEELIAACCN